MTSVPESPNLRAGSRGADGSPGLLRLKDASWIGRGVKGGLVVARDGALLRLNWLPYDDRALSAEGSVSATVVSPILVPRKAGPIQFLWKLKDFWRLDPADLVGLLGFAAEDSGHVQSALNGWTRFRGRDVPDRIPHLFRIRETLHALFQDLDVENEWLREPHDLLQGRSPMSLLLGGAMEDLLLVREYVEDAARR